MARPLKAAASVAAVLLAFGLAGCGGNPFTTASWSTRHSLSERECLARVMYFESNRSSPDGMTAVGTVVMNRLQSSRYPKTVCGVVGQENQFADGALSKPVSGRSYQLALAQADAVLAGERHPKVGAAMFFHTAGYTFPYRNMSYVVAAGGNVFYEKKTPGTFTPIHPNVLVAEAAGTARPRPTETIVLARTETVPGLDPEAGRSRAARARPSELRTVRPEIASPPAVKLARYEKGRRPTSHIRPEERRAVTLAKADRPSGREDSRTATGKAPRTRLAVLDERPGRKAVPESPRREASGRKPSAEPPSRLGASHPEKTRTGRGSEAKVATSLPPTEPRAAIRAPDTSSRDIARFASKPLAAVPGKAKPVVVASLPQRRGADEDDGPPRKRR